MTLDRRFTPLLSLLFGLFAVAKGASPKPLAGNEDFALTRQKSNLGRRSEGIHSDRSAYSFSIASSDGQVKDYLSPTGNRFESHVLHDDWGVWAGTGPQTMLVTVIDVQGEVDCTGLKQKVGAFEQADDVWDQGFMQAVLFQTNSSFHVASDMPGCLKGWQTEWMIKRGNATSDVGDFALAHVTAGSSIPQGPYLATIHGNMTLTPIYRSYQDSAQAFTSALVPTLEAKFVEMAANVPGMNTLSIPVPSRLYSLNRTDGHDLPLLGKRIAVKDIYDIAGTRTGCGNRAYWSTYGERDESAVSIQKLIDLRER